MNLTCKALKLEETFRLTGQIVISRIVDTDFSLQNEAQTSPGGVSSEGLYGVAHN